MRIAIHGRSFREEAATHVKELLSHLKARGAEVIIYAPFSEFLKKNGLDGYGKTYSEKTELAGADFVFSVGGDGTLLEAVTYVGEKQIPILGINAGRLGFLATTQRTDIQSAIDALYDGNYKYDERILIKLVSEEDLFDGVNFGLNEFAIFKKDSSSMIVVHTYIDGEYLNSYWADGLIVSTPTGSTGYSLSCGGPLMLPQLNNFIIAPVSPHNLNVRPMIVSDASVISFEIEGRSNNFLVSLDSRSKTVEATTKLAVKKEDFKARLVELKGYNYFQTLRNKLNWGLDLRN